MIRVRSAVRVTGAVACVALLVGGCSGAGSSSSAAGATGATGTATGSATGSPKATAGKTSNASPPPVSTDKPSVAVSTLPAVKVGAVATITPQVRVIVSKVKDVKVKANGPGEIAGPGISVSLTVENASGKAFDLGGLVVTASYGKNVPAPPAGPETGDALTGQLKSGKTAHGSYVFTVPAAKAGSVQVQVSSNESPNIVVVQR